MTESKEKTKMEKLKTALKTRKGTTATVGGAFAMIIGWVITDLMGYEIPKYIVQAISNLLS